MMIAAPAVVALLLLTPVPQQSPSPLDIVEMVEAGAEERLEVSVRRHSDRARDALHELLRRSVNGVSSEARWNALRVAERLAAVYAAAWDDPFLAREVARFQQWSLPDRRTKLRADSLRAAGNEAYATEGVGAALALWRRSLGEAQRIGDASGVARSEGNLGAGFYSAGQADSARVHLERAEVAARRVGDLRTVANAVTNRANLALDRGDLAGAVELYGEAEALLSRTGESRALAAVRHNLGLVFIERGEFERARGSLLRSLEGSRLGDEAGDEAEALATLADVAQAEGDYAEAALLLDRARNRAREGGAPGVVAGIDHSAGLLGLARGDYAAALRLLSAAGRAFLELGRVPDAVFVELDLAQARAATGDLRGALADLDRAAGQAASLSLGPLILADLAVTAAELHLAVNEFPLAVDRFREAGRLYAEAGDPAGEAGAVEGLGYLALVRGDAPEARELLSEALRMRSLRASDDPRAAALTRLYLAAAQEEAGDVAGARRTLDAAGTELQALGDPVGEAAVWGTRADLEARAGNLDLATSYYELGLQLLGNRVAPQVEWRLHLGRGRVLQSRGAWQEAAGSLRSAVVAIESTAVGLPFEARGGVPTDYAEAHQRLVEVLLELDDLPGAFEASERARARGSRAAELAARAAVAHVETSSAGERRRDLVRRIGELTRRLRWDRLPAPGLREAPLVVRRSSADLRTALARSQTEYLELVADLVRGPGADVPEAGPAPASIPEVQALLDPGRALVAYSVGERTTTVFVVRADTALAVTVDEEGQALGDLVDFARGTLGVGSGTGPGTRWRPPLRRLYETLIRPVERTGLIPPGTSLVVVPNRELHYLPFQALLRAEDESYLVERHAISYAPSAGAWLRQVAGARGEAGTMSLADDRRSRPSRVLAMAPRVDELPGSREEVEAIARLFPGRSTLLIGDRATETAFRRSGPKYDVIHLATYGVLNRTNPLFSFVELAESGDDPGLLELHEVLGIGLDARLLTLSACETAVGAGGLWDVPPGDDWTSLADAFLAAGAESVVASLWPVEDRATAALMVRFYRLLAAGRPVEDALAAAQREFSHDPVWAHPYYWAAFQLLGRTEGIR